MKPLFKYCFLMLLGGSPLFAQSRIDGHIKSTQGEALPFVNVLLLHATDSSLAKGAISDAEGKYLIEGIAPGKYILASSMIGFKKTFLPVFELAEHKNVSLGTLTMEEEASQLSEVVVQADKPLYEQRMDRLVINVENSVTSAGGTVLEVLERSPGVTVNRQSGAVTLLGKQGITVMMNGKLQRLPMDALIQQLEGMPANSIEKIELIANPSSKFDAQGDGGVINIVTKKSEGLGTNGSFSATLGYGRYGKSAASLSLNHRAKKINLYGNSSMSYFKVWNHIWIASTLSNPAQYVETNANKYVLRPIQQARVGMEWQAGKNTSINALVGGFINSRKELAFNNSHIRQNNLDSAHVLLYDEITNRLQNLMGNLNLNHTFKGGKTLNLDIDYLYYFFNNPQSYINDYDFLQSNTYRQDRIRVSKKTPVNMGVLKLDYSSIYQGIKFETGIKVTSSRLENDIILENYDMGGWFVEPKYTQDYAMKDDVQAAYVNMNGKLNKKGSFQLGLRTEHTDMEMVDGANSKVFDLDFWSVFPTAFYALQLNKDNAVQFSYGRRITRPSYSDMAPFFIFFDPYTYYSGNPKLKPTLSDGIQTSYSYKEWLVSLKYSMDRNSIVQLQTQFDPIEKKTRLFSANIDHINTLSLALAFPLKLTSWWKFQNNFTGMYMNLNTVYEGVPMQKDQWGAQCNSTMTFLLPRNFSTEITGMYNAPTRMGIGMIKSVVNIYVGLQKKLKNNSGTFSLNVSDLFFTNKYRYEFINPELNQNIKSRVIWSEPRVVRLTFAKTFGKKTVKVSRSRTTASEEEQKRAQ